MVHIRTVFGKALTVFSAGNNEVELIGTFGFEHPAIHLVFSHDDAGSISHTELFPDKVSLCSIDFPHPDIPAFFIGSAGEVIAEGACIGSSFRHGFTFCRLVGVCSQYTTVTLIAMLTKISVNFCKFKIPVPI